MPPVDTSDNPADDRLVDLKEIRQALLAYPADSVRSADCANIVLGQLCFVVPLTASTSPSNRAVTHILSIIPGVQAARVHAPRMITTMQHIKPIRNLTKVDDERNTVRVDGARPQPKLPVTTTPVARQPRPAFIRTTLVNLGPPPSHLISSQFHAPSVYGVNS